MATTHSYIITYGSMGYVGRFRAPLEGIERGQQVVIISPRGVEQGIVLCPADEPITSGREEAEGEILRAFTPDDELTSHDHEHLALTYLQKATDIAALNQVPVTFVDAEVLFEGDRMILYGCGALWEALPGWLEELSQQLGLQVFWAELSQTDVASEKKPAGCGTSGCGDDGGCSTCSSSGEGGCETGSCSRGKVDNPEALSAWFLQLREQMEREQYRIPLG